MVVTVQFRQQTRKLKTQSEHAFGKVTTARYTHFLKPVENPPLQEDGDVLHGVVISTPFPTATLFAITVREYAQFADL